jgi:hypothetical protein
LKIAVELVDPKNSGVSSVDEVAEEDIPACAKWWDVDVEAVLQVTDWPNFTTERLKDSYEEPFAYLPRPLLGLLILC